MKKLILAATMLAMGSGLGGCATVLNGTKQPVEFQSEPTGATIRLFSGLTCQTPCEFEMRRGDDSMVTFTLPGYEPVEVYIQSRTGGSVAGNIIAGGLIGGVVDASNGASNHLYPDPVFVRMVPAGSGGQAMLLDKDGQVISSVADYNARVASDVLEGLRGQGVTPGVSPQN